MSSAYEVKLLLIDSARKQLRTLAKPVLDALFKNFIRPLRAGNPAAHLEGKYKPSWEVPISNHFPMRDAMAKAYKRENCFHYHFGYPVYTEGRDAKFSGKVSDGIVHTIFNTEDKQSSCAELHIVLQIDPEHPHPFSAPIHLLREVSTASDF